MLAVPTTMTIPRSIETECPQCGEETLHRVLQGRLGKRRGTTLDATARCTVCKHTHPILVRESGPLTVRAILSDRRNSKRLTVTLPPTAVVSLGDTLESEFPLLVTAIEVASGRVAKARATDIRTIWGKRFDEVPVRLSINRGRKTIAGEVVAVPEEEFSVGQRIEIDDRPVAIHAIKTKEKLIETGSALASEIIRAYCHPVADGRPPKIRRPRPW